MNSLNLYKDRKYSVVNLGDKDYKIPNEYFVEEVERILELKKEQEKIENEEVDEEKKKEQLDRFWDNAYTQLEVLIQHHQPNVTIEELKKEVTHSEVLSILGFFDKYRPKAINDAVKKKLK